MFFLIRRKQKTIPLFLFLLAILSFKPTLHANTFATHTYANLNNRLTDTSLRKNHKSHTVSVKQLNAASWGFDWLFEPAGDGYVFIKNRLNGDDKYLRQDFKSKNVRAISLNKKSWGFYWHLEVSDDYIHIKNRLSNQYLRTAANKSYLYSTDLSNSWGFDWQIKDKKIQYQENTPEFHTLVNNDDAIDAVRFLTQATFGPKDETIRALLNSNYETWINEQFNVPQTIMLPLLDERIRLYGMDPLDKTVSGQASLKEKQRSDIWWDTVINRNDQLRQRVAYALSQIFVISNEEATISHDARGMMHYHDMLAEHALGNFRDLLQDVTLHQMMGEYLSMVRNEKANLEKNIRPDENFARELMQLFTIGLVMLNVDGSPQLDAQGNTLPTYDQDMVDSFSRVFTGWTYADATTWKWRVKDNASSEIKPMKAFQEYHDIDEKRSQWYRITR